MSRRKSKRKKSKKESKILPSSSSSEHEEKTSHCDEDTKKRKHSEKKRLDSGHVSHSEKTRREHSNDVSESSTRKDRPYKRAVYRLEKTSSSHAKPRQKEKGSDTKNTCPPDSRSQNKKSGAGNGTVVTTEVAKISKTGSSTPSEGKSSTSQGGSCKSSHRSATKTASSREARSPRSLSSDLKEQRRRLVKRRSRPDERSSRVTQDLQLPSSLAEELRDERRTLVKRRSQKERQEVLKTIRDLSGRQGPSTTGKIINSSTATKSTSSEKTMPVSKPVTPKQETFTDLSKTVKSTCALVPPTKPKLPLNFTIPKKTKPAPVKSEIWGEDDEGTDTKPIVSASTKSVYSKSELGSKLMVPRKIGILEQRVLNRRVLLNRTKKTAVPVPGLSSSISATPSAPLPGAKQEPIVDNSSVQTKASSSETTEIYDNDQEMQLVEEIHQARSERRLDLKVVETYGELTCMDIDPPEEGATDMLNKDPAQQELIFVLDTNILLSHLDFVKKIRSHGLGGLGFPIVLIPWVVLQELDSLKNGKRLSSSVAHLATPAVHYIYTSLKSQEPRLWGQSMQQAAQSSKDLTAENNDDRVLQCCLQYQTLHPGRAVVLCTNDKNLCSKSLLSGVKALSKADLVEEVRRFRPGVLSPLLTPQTHTQTPTLNQPCTHTQTSHQGALNQPCTQTSHQRALYQACTQTSHQRASPCPRPRKDENDQGARNGEKEDRREEEEEEERKRSCATAQALSMCVSVLEGALSQVLEVEMKAAFGDLWTEIVYLKPPWTLGELLQCVRKHWIAVFGSIVPRGLLHSVEHLCDFFNSGRSVERSSITVAVSEARDLLQAFHHRSSYSAHISHALSSLDSLMQRPHPQPETASEKNHACEDDDDDDDDDDTLMSEEEEKQATPPQASHQEVWSLFEHIWINVCQTSSAVFSALQFDPGTMETSQLGEGSPPPLDAVAVLHTLASAVTHLLQVLSRVLHPGSGLDDCQALLTFILSSEIAAMEPRFTAKDLMDCLSQQEYREKLHVGGTQLAQLNVSLERCVEAMTRRATSTTWA